MQNTEHIFFWIAVKLSVVNIRPNPKCMANNHGLRQVTEIRLAPGHPWHIRANRSNAPMTSMTTRDDTLPEYTQRTIGVSLRGAGIVLLAASHMSGWAWGSDSHQLVARIAQSQLAPKVQQEVQKLLNLEPDSTLVSISTWADETLKSGRQVDSGVAVEFERVVNSCRLSFLRVPKIGIGRAAFAVGGRLGQSCYG